MTLAIQGKTVLFLTDPGDPLVREFAIENDGRGLAFLSDSARADWCVARVCDDNGQVQAWLEHLPSGQRHWLGADPQQAMRSACRLITEWDKLEAGHTEALAVQ